MDKKINFLKELKNLFEKYDVEVRFYYDNDDCCPQDEIVFDFGDERIRFYDISLDKENIEWKIKDLTK
jgi:hypothetical protein